MRTYRSLLGICILFILPLTSVRAQGTRADYERAFRFRERFEGLALNIVDRVAWIEGTHRFWYRRSVKGGARIHAGGCGDAREATGLRSRAACGLAFSSDGTFLHGDDATFRHAHLRGSGASDRIRRPRRDLEMHSLRLRLPSDRASSTGSARGARSRRGIPARVRERCLRWDGLPPSVLPLPPTDAADAPRPTVQSHPIR